MVNKPTRMSKTTATTATTKQAMREQEFESSLSQEQLQLLEQENNSLLEGYESTLDQIKSFPPYKADCRGAEKALLEISALQNELMTQLSSQASLTDRLYDDALETTESVEKGNKQLVRARKRHKSTTLFVMVFLLVMTMLLLFLDSWY